MRRGYTVAEDHPPQQKGKATRKCAGELPPSASRLQGTRSVPTDAELRETLYRVREALSEPRQLGPAEMPAGLDPSSILMTDKGLRPGSGASCVTGVAGWEARLLALQQLHDVVIASSSAEGDDDGGHEDQGDAGANKLACATRNGQRLSLREGSFDISTRGVFRAEMHSAFKGPLLRHLEDSHCGIQVAAAKVLTAFFERASDTNVVTALSNAFTKPLLRLTASAQPGVARAAARALQAILRNHFGAQAFSDVVRAAAASEKRSAATAAGAASASNGNGKPNPRSRCHALHAILYATRHVPGTPPHAVVAKYMEAVAHVVQQGLLDASEVVRGAAASTYWGLALMDPSLAAQILSSLNTFTRSRVLATRRAALDLVGVMPTASTTTTTRSSNGHGAAAAESRHHHSSSAAGHYTDAAPSPPSTARLPFSVAMTATTAAERMRTTSANWGGESNGEKLEEALSAVSARAARRAALRQASARQQQDRYHYYHTTTESREWYITSSSTPASPRGKGGLHPGGGGAVGGMLHRRDQAFHADPTMAMWSSSSSPLPTTTRKRSSSSSHPGTTAPLTVDGLLLSSAATRRSSSSNALRYSSAAMGSATRVGAPAAARPHPQAVLRHSGASSGGRGGGEGCRTRSARTTGTATSMRSNAPSTKERVKQQPHDDSGTNNNNNDDDDISKEVRITDWTALMGRLEADDWKQREAGLQRLQTSAAWAALASVTASFSTTGSSSENTGIPTPTTAGGGGNNSGPQAQDSSSAIDGAGANHLLLFPTATTTTTPAAPHAIISIDTVLCRVTALLTDGIRRVGLAALRSIAALLAWLSEVVVVVVEEEKRHSEDDNNNHHHSPPHPPHEGQQDADEVCMKNRRAAVVQKIRPQLPFLLFALAELSLSLPSAHPPLATLALSSSITQKTLEPGGIRRMSASNALLLSCLVALRRAVFTPLDMLVGVCKALLADPEDWTHSTPVPLQARLLEMLQWVLEEGHRDLTLGTDDARWIARWFWPAVVPLLLRLSSSSSSTSSSSATPNLHPGRTLHNSPQSQGLSSAQGKLLRASLCGAILSAYVAAPAALTRCVTQGTTASINTPSSGSHSMAADGTTAILHRSSSSITRHRQPHPDQQQEQQQQPRQKSEKRHSAARAPSLPAATDPTEESTSSVGRRVQQALIECVQVMVPSDVKLWEEPAAGTWPRAPVAAYAAGMVEDEDEDIDDHRDHRPLISAIGLAGLLQEASSPMVSALRSWSMAWERDAVLSDVDMIHSDSHYDHPHMDGEMDRFRSMKSVNRNTLHRNPMATLPMTTTSNTRRNKQNRRQGEDTANSLQRQPLQWPAQPSVSFNVSTTQTRRKEAERDGMNPQGQQQDHPVDALMRAERPINPSLTVRRDPAVRCGPPPGLTSLRLFRSTLSPQYQLDAVRPSSLPSSTVNAAMGMPSSVHDTLRRYLTACGVSPPSQSYSVERGGGGGGGSLGATAQAVAGALLAGLHFHNQLLQGGSAYRPARHRNTNTTNNSSTSNGLEECIISSPEFSCEALLECVQYHMVTPVGSAGWAEEAMLRLLVRRLQPFLRVDLGDGAATSSISSSHVVRSSVRRRAFGVLAALLVSPPLQCFLPPFCEQFFRWCRQGLDDPFAEVQQAAAGCLRTMLYASTVPLDTCLNGLAACLESTVATTNRMGFMTDGWVELLLSVGRLFERHWQHHHSQHPDDSCSYAAASGVWGIDHSPRRLFASLDGNQYYPLANEEWGGGKAVGEQASSSLPCSYKGRLQSYTAMASFSSSASPGATREEHGGRSRRDVVTRTVFMRLTAVLRMVMEQPTLPMRVRDVCVRVLAMMRWAVPAATEVFPMILLPAQQALVNAFSAEVQ